MIAADAATRPLLPFPDSPRMIFVASSALLAPTLLAGEQSLTWPPTLTLVHEEMMTFAIKTEVREPEAETFTFVEQKTMYGGKRIAEGDTVYVFASENEGGRGLIARGIVTLVEAVARKDGVARQTPRVSVAVRRTALAKQPLGRRELKRFADWDDGQPGTELNFKFYRQATNKVVGISDDAAAFLYGFF